MRLNMGAGFNKLDGFTNVDRESACKPDLLLDLDSVPFWPFQDNSIDEIRAHHVLEHLVHFKTFFQEAYRVMKHGATLDIRVPHHLSDEQFGDPTHVRAVTPQQLQLLDKDFCEECRRMNAANSQLATYWDVDFELVSVNTALKPRWMADTDIQNVLDSFVNVAAEVGMMLRCRKS